MSKQWTPRKSTVELAAEPARVSRIRREPPPPPREQRAPRDFSDENEVWVVAIGVVLFAIAITIIIFAISDYTN